jgi:hypothetical protein
MPRNDTGILAAALAAAILAAACAECRTTADCPTGKVCINGACRDRSSTDTSTDTDVVEDGDTVGDTGDDTATDTGPGDTTPSDTAGEGTDSTDAPADGETICTTDEECEDSNVCTDDYCHESFHICVNLPLDGADCDDGDLCNGVGVCDDTGTCVTESSPLCDDLNDCTFDTCVGGGTDCTHDAEAMEGSSCDDGLYCDGPDSCSSGVCMADDPGYAACSDGDTCTLDSCTEGSSGPVCAHESVITFRPLTCGATVTGTTTGAGEASSYGSSCTGGTLGAGPEEILVFGHSADTDVTFTLVTVGLPTADNNDLYVLTDGCDPSSCTAMGLASVTYTGLAAGTLLYVSVESVVGGAYFAVMATCS